MLFIKPAILDIQNLCLCDSVITHLIFYHFFSPGTDFTLLHNACRPPLVSLSSSGQVFGVFPSVSCSSSSILPSFSSPPDLPDTAFAVLVPLSAPGVCTPFSCLRVSPGRRSGDWPWWCPNRTRWPERRDQSKGSGHSTSILPWLSTTSSNQPQTHQLTQYCCHLSGQL